MGPGVVTEIYFVHLLHRLSYSSASASQTNKQEYNEGTLTIEDVAAFGLRSSHKKRKEKLRMRGRR